MDDQATNYDLLKSSIAEAVAYFLLVICIFFSDGESTKFLYGFWSILMVFGNISGAHINPIITFSLWLYNGDHFIKPHLLKLISYFIAQIVGACLGATTCYFIYDWSTSYVKCPETSSYFSVMFVETFFSGTLTFVALFICSPTTRPTNKNYVNLTLLSIWFMLIENCGQNISGASYNPTFFLVLNGFALVTKVDKDAYNRFEIYFLAPFLGAFFFTLIFKYMFKPFYASRNKNDRISLNE